MEEAVRLLVVDGVQPDRIEAETASEPLGDDAEIEHRAAAEAVRLVEGEGLALAHGLHEVPHLRRGIGKFREDLLCVELLAVPVHETEGLAVLRLLVDAQSVRATEKRLVEAYRLADGDAKKAAMKLLKGECPELASKILGGSGADMVADLLGDALGSLLGGR